MLFGIKSTTANRNPIDDYPELHEFGYDGTFIKLSSLEDLMRLHTLVGYPLICEYTDDLTPIIEIYDGWRELDQL